MNKTLKITLIVIGIILLLIFLYPKKSGYGHGGEVMMDGQPQMRQENSCFGASYWIPASHMGPLGLTRCVDCGSTKYCVGIPYNKQCYLWTAGTPIETEKLISCGK